LHDRRPGLYLLIAGETGDPVTAGLDVWAPHEFR
jgi:hypothetical protein